MKVTTRGGDPCQPHPAAAGSRRSPAAAGEGGSEAALQHSNNERFVVLADSPRL
jgi:hypothetical protein